MKKFATISAVGALVLGSMVFAAPDNAPTVHGMKKNSTLTPFIGGDLNGQFLVKHKESQSGKWEALKGKTKFPVVLDTANFWLGAMGTTKMMDDSHNISYGGKARIDAFGGNGGTDPNHARIDRAQAWIGTDITGTIHAGTQRNFRYLWATGTQEAGNDSIVYYYTRGGRWFQFYSPAITNYTPGINYETPNLMGLKIGLGYNVGNNPMVSGGRSTSHNNLGLTDNLLLKRALNVYDPKFKFTKNVTESPVGFFNPTTDPELGESYDQIEYDGALTGALNYGHQWGDLNLALNLGLTYAKVNDKTHTKTFQTGVGTDTQTSTINFAYNDIMVYNVDLLLNYRGFILAGEYFDNGKSGNVKSADATQTINGTTKEGKKFTETATSNLSFSGDAGMGYNSTVGYQIGKWKTALVFAQEFATPAYISGLPGFQTLNKSTGTSYGITGSYMIVPGVQTYVGINIATTSFGTDVRQNLVTTGKKENYADTTDIISIVGLDVSF